MAGYLLKRHRLIGSNTMFDHKTFFLVEERHGLRHLCLKLLFNLELCQQILLVQPVINKIFKGSQPIAARYFRVSESSPWRRCSISATSRSVTSSAWAAVCVSILAATQHANGVLGLTELEKEFALCLGSADLEEAPGRI